MSRETEQELTVISETAANHLDELRDQASRIPIIVWTSYHVIHEMYAGAANLQAIKQNCKRGHLAIQELSEMLERDELKEISPEETTLLSVTSNVKEKEIEFVYKLGASVELTTEQLLVVGAMGAMMGVICFLVTSNVKVLNTLRGHNEDHAYEEPTESPGATRRRIRFPLEDALA